MPYLWRFGLVVTYMGSQKTVAIWMNAAPFVPASLRIWKADTAVAWTCASFSNYIGFHST